MWEQYAANEVRRVLPSVTSENLGSKMSGRRIINSIRYLRIHMCASSVPYTRKQIALNTQLPSPAISIRC